MNPLSPSPPRSPLSTRLSGSARETELRIRSIFQWKKKRPPVLLMALAGAAILLCGSLVSCQVQAAAPTAGPEFTLTHSGTETVPFDRLLGYSGTVTHTVSDEGADQYIYEIVLPEDTVFTLAELSGQVFHLDLNGDGELDLIAASPTGRLVVFQRWPDGSIRSQDLSQAAGELLGLEPRGWEDTALTFHPEDRTVTVQSAFGQTQVFPLSQLLETARTGEIILPSDQQPLEDGIRMVFCDRVNLDGHGGQDDSAVVTAQSFDTGYFEGQAVLEVTLGSGEVLRWTDDCSCYPVLRPAFLTSSQQECLLLELQPKSANYGAANYYVLEVTDGQLSERLRLEVETPQGLLSASGAYVRTGTDGLQELRLPTVVDKWRNPMWCTLSWSEEAQQFQSVSDGFFTDLDFVTVEGDRTLTLELRGRRSPDDNGPWLYYDQISVWENGRLLQAILPEFPLPASNVFDADTLARTTIPADHYFPKGFATTYTFDTYIQDVNFDGSEDLGLPCDTSYTEMHAWYLWNPAREQFEYAFAVAGELTLDEKNQQIIERPYNPDVPGGIPAAYSFNARGQLVWTGSPE